MLLCSQGQTKKRPRSAMNRQWKVWHSEFSILLCSHYKRIQQMNSAICMRKYHISIEKTSGFRVQNQRLIVAGHPIFKNNVRVPRQQWLEIPQAIFEVTVSWFPHFFVSQQSPFDEGLLPYTAMPVRSRLEMSYRLHNKLFTSGLFSQVYRHHVA